MSGRIKITMGITGTCAEAAEAMSGIGRRLLDYVEMGRARVEYCFSTGAARLEFPVKENVGAPTKAEIQQRLEGFPMAIKGLLYKFA